MRKSLLILLPAVATSLPAFCGDEQFNGVWDIRATGQPRARWLEIDGEGQTQPTGQWIGARAPFIDERDDGTWREGKPESARW